ncbi:diaminopimelate epimerase [candidate division WOR-3 bacterium]|nr:diaminopimelate epimerase [candidate division WOR-3 bacterium]
MIEFVKGEGGGNDFILISHRNNYNYSKLALRLLQRRVSIGGDGLVVMDGKRMRFFNPDGVEVPFCGNGVRVFFYLLYLEGNVRDKDEIITGAGTIPLKYEGDGRVSAMMPEIKIGEEMGNGIMVYCGVPHLIIQMDDIENIDVESEGRQLSTLLPDGNNVNWVVDKGDFVLIRTYERGVDGETLSCASGIASASYIIMEESGVDKIIIKSKGGDFKAERCRDRENRLFLIGDVKITFKGVIPEKEVYWQKKGI